MTGGAPSAPTARLAFVLQQLRQRTGLSLAQLANATTFSKSSWERYLNGKCLPPRSAVKELCRLAGEPADHPLALLDIARTDRVDRSADTVPTRRTPARQSAGTRTATPAPASAPASSGIGGSDTAPSGTGPSGTVPGDPGLPGHRRATVLAALASACAVVLGTFVLVNLPVPHREDASPSHALSATTGVLCRQAACQDKDPIATKCAAAPLTLAERETATGAWIQIRYSRECGTSWARMWGAVLDDRVEFRAGGGDGSLRGARVTSRDQADTYVHTLMSVVGPGTSLQACFSPAAGGGKECLETRTDQASPPLDLDVRPRGSRPADRRTDFSGPAGSPRTEKQHG